MTVLERSLHTDHEVPRRPDLRRPRKLTREARALLAQADAGGVPAFISQNLRRIAQENGVEITEDMTPNAIVDALRAAMPTNRSPGPRADDLDPRESVP